MALEKLYLPQTLLSFLARFVRPAETLLRFFRQNFVATSNFLDHDSLERIVARNTTTDSMLGLF